MMGRRVKMKVGGVEGGVESGGVGGRGEMKGRKRSRRSRRSRKRRSRRGAEEEGGVKEEE